MNLVSALILAVVLLLAVAAAVYYVRSSRSCSGPCDGCSRTDCPRGDSSGNANRSAKQG